ncbi:MAG TPA: RluA family pseudouridine synthase [Candidatus Acidoferrum sp.]|nr:RluA family pseudouridine synthase [Candidatus Acidoferrum sp.]
MDSKTTEIITETRLDVAVAALLEISRAAAQRLIVEGMVTVNGKAAQKAGLKLSPGEVIEAALPPPAPDRAKPQDIPLTIVYEDAALLVVDKPRGLVVHPAAGNPDGTLVNALLHHCGDSLSGINGVMRPGIVHRIDKDTSGLLLVAKTDAAHRSLAAQIASHSLLRAYVALVHGHLKELQGAVDAPIARNPHRRKEMAVVPGGRRAVTHYKVLEEYEGFSLLECRLETGRTHQIRVHMAHLGRPVVGDPVYAKDTPDLGGQLLHAARIGFRHPVTGQWLEFLSPVPAYFSQYLTKLRSRNIIECSSIEYLQGVPRG